MDRGEGAAPSTRPQSWTRYIREVTKYDQFKLLELVAEASCDQLRRSEWAAGFGKKWQPDNSLHPFVLARIARDAILSGLDTANKIPRLEDLERLCTRYIELDDPISRPDAVGGGSWNFLVRVAYEQFPFQLNPHNELSRSWALFARTAEAIGAQTMMDASWRSTLGCDLDEFLRMTFAWQAAASVSRGRVPRTMLNDPEVLTFLGNLTLEDVWRVTTQRLSGDIRRLRKDPGNRPVPRGLEKHRYNPLTARPYVRRRELLIVPSPQLAAQRAWPNSLYYDRVKDEGFTNELGDVFEKYVGQQLALLEDAGIAQVLPKVPYREQRRELESIDHFLVFPEVLVLVEAKASRLTAEARLGADRLKGDVTRTLGVAYSQIGTTAELIRAGRGEFAHLPSDRPILGLAVTMEPYFVGWRPAMLPDMPTGVTTFPVSCSDIEGFVSTALAGPVQDILLTLANMPHPVGRAFNTAFEGRPAIGNPILDAAFDDLMERF